MWGWADGRLYKDVAFLRRMIAQTLIASRSTLPTSLHVSDPKSVVLLILDREGLNGLAHVRIVADKESVHGFVWELTF